VVRGSHLEVVGRGAVTIFDGSRITSNAHYAKRSEPILASGVVLHVLPATATFDLQDRVLLSYGPQPSASAIAELEGAEADLRKLANEIAAEGVSPRYYAERKRRAGKRTASRSALSVAAGESRPEATEPITAGADPDHVLDRTQPEE
jgi:cyanophycinase